MEEFAQRTNNRRRQRRKAKASRNKVIVEPVLIAARRPDSPLIRNGSRNVVASAQPKRAAVAYLNGLNGVGGNAEHVTSEPAPAGLGVNGAEAAAVAQAQLSAAQLPGAQIPGGAAANGAGAHANGKRREVRIVQVGNHTLDTDERKRRLLDRLVRAEGRSAISRVADDLWDSKFALPREQEVHLQLLEHENEERAREAVFIIAELLQKEAPIKRPILDQRLRRLEEYAEDPITRDAAAALRRSIRFHHGG